jgi:hypothetical protein
LRESLSDSDMDLSLTFNHSQNSSASDIPSPITPIFSTRGHFRFPSSTSSIESTLQFPAIESPTSPSVASKPGKRSLPDVQEEPQERDDRDDEVDEFNFLDEGELYDCLCKLRRDRNST